MRDLPSADVWSGSLVWGVVGRTLAAMHGGRTRLVTADAVILATGALERLVPFPGWTLEGVMTVEAGWELVRAGGVGQASGPAVVAGGAAAGTVAGPPADLGDGAPGDRAGWRCDPPSARLASSRRPTRDRKRPGGSCARRRCR